MSVERLGIIGGVFAILVFWHFFADWTFQSHAEALAKSKDRAVRAWHCIKYAAAFVPLFMLLKINSQAFALSCVVLFYTHYVIDSYVPVALWAKYLRRAPQFNEHVLDPVTARQGHTRPKTDEEAFKDFAATPLGLILMIMMDQFFHIACLLPVAWLITS